MQSTLKRTRVLLLLLISLMLLSGCSLLKMIPDVISNNESKIFHERLDEISAEFKSRYEKKYGEQFEELGFKEVYRGGYIFWFRSKETGVKFGSSYFGDYLHKDFPEKLEGEFKDNYWNGRIDYAVSQYFKPYMVEHFSGDIKYLRIQTYFSDMANGGVLDNWDTDLSSFYKIDYLTKELYHVPSFSIVGIYFKDVTKANADELYREMYDLVMKFKEEGVEDLDITIDVYDEKYLTDKRIDFEDLDDNTLINASNRIFTALNARDLLLDEINSYEDFLKKIIVLRFNGEYSQNDEFWLGGKDGN